jgi:hypothetical protein
MNYISPDDGSRDNLNGSEAKVIKGSPSPLGNNPRGRNQGRKDSLDPIKRVALKGELNLTSLTSEIIKYNRSNQTLNERKPVKRI